MNTLRLEKKSYLVGFLCTLVVGPIGMFYISVGAGLGWTLGGIALSVGTGGMLAPVIWLFSIVACLHGVQTFNRYLDESQVAREAARTVRNPAVRDRAKVVDDYTTSKAYPGQKYPSMGSSGQCEFKPKPGLMAR